VEIVDVAGVVIFCQAVVSILLCEVSRETVDRAA
jgi:hypothetical protein